MIRTRKVILFISIILILLLSGILLFNILSGGKLTTPEDALTKYLTEIQKRPFSYDKAISYVYDIVLDDEFLNSIKEESRDVDFPTFSQFNIIGSTIHSSDEEASINVELIFDGDYNINKTFYLKKVKGDWKVNLQNVQEEYYSILDEH